MSVGETITRNDNEPIREVVGSIRRIEAVFGKCIIASGDQFEPDYWTPNIHASEHDIATGAAQRVPTCGDQTPAYLGFNGPTFEVPDTI